MRAVDLTGQRFTRLTVTCRAPNIGAKTAWRCRCDCGADVVSPTSALRSGDTKSCGCWGRDAASRNAVQRNTVHGHNRATAKTPTWQSWRAMHKRCSQVSHVSFPDYGGRGIVVCARWRDFTAFLADMGERPTGTTLDRIEVNGNYEPGNCRWATGSEQQKNKRVHAHA